MNDTLNSFVLKFELHFEKDVIISDKEKWKELFKLKGQTFFNNKPYFTNSEYIGFYEKILVYPDPTNKADYFLVVIVHGSNIDGEKSSEISEILNDVSKLFVNKFDIVSKKKDILSSGKTVSVEKHV